VQETGFGCRGGLDYMLKVTGRVACNFLLCVAVTCTGDEDGRVDDQAAEFFEGLVEAGKDVAGWPDIGAEVFGERRGG
jgi:hypothetical protein